MIVLRSNTPERVDERPPLDFDEDDEYEAYDGPQYDTEQPRSLPIHFGTVGSTDADPGIANGRRRRGKRPQKTPRRRRCAGESDERALEEPPSKKRRIQILNVTEAATIRAEATGAKSAVELSNCAICQEDDAPMDTVFTGAVTCRRA